MTTALKRIRATKRSATPKQESKPEENPWLAHEMSSHFPNAESLKAIEEALVDDGEEITLADLRKQWNEEPFTVTRGKYKFLFSPESEGGFSVSCLNVKGINAQGETFEEAFCDALSAAEFVEQCVADIKAGK